MQCFIFLSPSGGVLCTCSALLGMLFYPECTGQLFIPGLCERGRPAYQFPFSSPIEVMRHTAKANLSLYSFR